MGTYRIHLSWFSNFTRDFQKRGSEEPNFPIDSAGGGFRNCLPYFWICYMAMILTWVEWVRVWFKLGLFTHRVWLVVDLPLWKMMEFVSWDDDIPNIWENKIHVPKHQPVVIISYNLLTNQPLATSKPWDKPPFWRLKDPIRSAHRGICDDHIARRSETHQTFLWALAMEMRLNIDID